ncbi:MAG: SUMF1/EgtB/PvdO family nonheme iron enzyme, partial [Myxococcales bacterium]|nr:SUMF1/EgtB/PvdO family nonheme iron enzyme [Myxococcales bacterium]
WHQAESYCRAQGGRLPSEAEWEWAARGGDQHRSYAWGEDDPDPTLVNACGRECSTPENLFDRRDGHRGTAPAGTYRRGRGRWYLEDLAGNVWEWTQSGDADDRVVRGGGFSTVDDGELRVGGRESIELRARRADVGFRCVWDPADAP